MSVIAPASLLVAGIGEMVLSADPAVRLVAYGLGSCVALAAWDPRANVGGLAHFMLPEGTPQPRASSGGAPVKFIEPGLDTFLTAFARQGGSPGRTVFRAAGGAAMLSVGGGLGVGKRNAEAMQTALRERGLRLAAEDLGGNAGRTVQLEVAGGRFLVKSLSRLAEL